MGPTERTKPGLDKGKHNVNCYGNKGGTGFANVPKNSKGTPTGQEGDIGLASTKTAGGHQRTREGGHSRVGQLEHKKETTGGQHRDPRRFNNTQVGHCRAPFNRCEVYALRNAAAEGFPQQTLGA